MKSKEEILNEIQSVMKSNKKLIAQCNQALSDAICLIAHNDKKLGATLEEEYERGMNETWDTVRKLFTDYNKYEEIYGKGFNIRDVILLNDPKTVKNNIESCNNEDSDEDKVCPGDIVEHQCDGAIATLLDNPNNDDLWHVITDLGRVETWFEEDFEKIGEHVDLKNILFDSQKENDE